MHQKIFLSFEKYAKRKKKLLPKKFKNKILIINSKYQLINKFFYTK